uniref:ORF52b n=1 Tax=Cydia pomonella granulosis virus TaxID=28289 RepID=A0A097P2B4_GVCP|nr:ORF52b [Cydia pomonella granulovirus]AIU37259.1 ORF52b [Cydia pomonella granulovirus]QDW81111.1 orf52b [Cydia pomonella granulovirus]QGY99926.1 ORF52b [Cydia pomonella granulovirus]
MDCSSSSSSILSSSALPITCFFFLLLLSARSSSNFPISSSVSHSSDTNKSCSSATCPLLPATPLLYSNNLLSTNCLVSLPLDVLSNLLYAATNSWSDNNFLRCLSVTYFIATSSSSSCGGV